MAENNKPTNIERLSDLIDLEVEDGQEVQIEEPTPTDSDIAVEIEEDGSAEVNYFPDDEPTQMEAPFDANLSEYLSDQDLGMIANELIGDFEDDHASRAEWEETPDRRGGWDMPSASPWIDRSEGGGSHTHRSGNGSNRPESHRPQGNKNGSKLQ